MEIIKSLKHISAAKAQAVVFGVLGGLGGIRHGIGEIVQGNIAPQALLINSWTQGPLATNMGGEPALTLVPNLLATGELAISMSAMVIVWSVAFVQRRYGGLILLLLGITLFLVGGGFGPPIIVVLAGVAGLGIDAQYTWWQSHVPIRVRRILARLWSWVFAVGVINGLFLFISSLILVCVFGMNDPGLFLNSFFLAVLSLLLSVMTGIAYDIQQSTRGSAI